MNSIKTHLLGFTSISDQEAAMMVNSFGMRPEKALENIELIDRLLITQKTFSLLNKKRGLKARLSDVIDNYVKSKNKQ